MLSVSRNGYALQGLGVTPAPYTCKSTICYGSDGGATHALFKETQYQMNRAGVATFGTSWRTIAVDGFIGAETAAAARVLFPRFAALKMYSNPTDFRQLAYWISEDRSIPTTLRGIADQLKPSTAQPPQVVENRIDTFAKEGPAAGSVPPAPNVPIPKPDVYIPPVTQQPPVTQPPSSGGFWPTPVAPAEKSKAFVWVVVGIAATGLIATAAMVARRRRR